jgi:hypothetical protein
VDVTGDCDDTNSGVNPDRVEDACDGQDDDCDGAGGPDSDEDTDGLTFAEEDTLGTDPCLADTDGDGIGDADDPTPTGESDSGGGRETGEPDDTGPADTESPAEEPATPKDDAPRCGCGAPVPVTMAAVLAGLAMAARRRQMGRPPWPFP